MAGPCVVAASSHLWFRLAGSASHLPTGIRTARFHSADVDAGGRKIGQLSRPPATCNPCFGSAGAGIAALAGTTSQRAAMTIER